jgi:hypothetical protein
MVIFFTDIHLYELFHHRFVQLLVSEDEENVNYNYYQKEKYLPSRRMYQIRRQIRCMRRPWGKKAVQTMRHRRM